jgi:hypothetical protein
MHHIGARQDRSFKNLPVFVFSLRRFACEIMPEPSDGLVLAFPGSQSKNLLKYISTLSIC